VYLPDGAASLALRDQPPVRLVRYLVRTRRARSAPQEVSA
jgi:hypothetical protein